MLWVAPVKGGGACVRQPRRRASTTSGTAAREEDRVGGVCSCAGLCGVPRPPSPEASAPTCMLAVALLTRREGSGDAVPSCPP
jgi:hypothetical protein